MLEIPGQINQNTLDPLDRLRLALDLPVVTPARSSPVREHQVRELREIMDKEIDDLQKSIMLSTQAGFDALQLSASRVQSASSDSDSSDIDESEDQSSDSDEQSSPLGSQPPRDSSLGKKDDVLRLNVLTTIQEISPQKSPCMTSKILLAATTIGTFANLMFNRPLLEMSHKILDNPFFHFLKTTIPFDMTAIAMATPFAIAGGAIVADICTAACSRDKPKRDCTAMGNTISLLIPTALTAYYASDALDSLNGSKESFQISSCMAMTVMSTPLFLAAYNHLKSATNSHVIVNAIALGILATNIAFLAHTGTYHHTALEMVAGNLVGAVAGAGIYALSSLASKCYKFVQS